MADSTFIDTETIGSAGTLVAAGMETAGHYLQSGMLDILEAGLYTSLGGFLYLFSAIVALFTVAIGGNYKFGLWFIFGVVLSSQILQSRVPSKGVTWEFGATEHSQQMVEDATEGVTPENQVGRVSSFFAIWNRFTSSIIQTFISTLQLTDLKSDVQFITRSGRYASLFQLQIQDQNLRNFIQLVVNENKCVGYLSLQMARFQGVSVVKGARTPAEVIQGSGYIPVTEIEAQLRNIENRVVLTKADSHFRWLETLYQTGWFPGETLKEQYSCKDLWGLSMTALKTEALQNSVRAASENRRPELDFDDTFQTMAKKFDDSNAQFEDGDVAFMINALAVRLFYQSMKEIRPSMAQLDHSQHLRESDGKASYDVSQDLRFLAGSYEYHGKGEYLNLMLALPYIQGIVLYFLAFLFPFFVMALIVPGRHHMFFLWMGMWFWAKSWDLGFAVVMLMDELLYYLLPHGPAMTEELMAEPGMAFQVMLQADPTYSVSAYYNIMATLLGAVPVVTGMLIKRGGGEVMDAVSQGFSNFGGKIANSMAAFARSMKSQGLSKEAEDHKMEAGRAAMVGALRDPEISKALGINLGAQVLQNMSGKDLVSTIQKGMAGMASGKAKELVKAKMNLHMKVAMWEQSLSDANIRRGELAVLQKFYRHDFSEHPSYSDYTDVAVARRVYKFGGPVSDSLGGSVKQVVDRQMQRTMDLR